MTIGWAFLALVAVAVVIVVSSELSKHRHWPSAMLFFALFGFLWMTLRYSPPVDTRIISLALGGLALIMAASRHRLTFNLPGTAILPFTLVLASATWSDAPTVDILGQAAFTVALIIAVSVYITERSLVASVGFIFVFTTISTGLAILVAPSAARLAGRLTGPFENPNTLGAILALTYPAAIKTFPRLAPLTSIITLAILWETGSRAALLAVLIEILVFSWLRMAPAIRPFAVLAAIIAIYQIAPTLLSTFQTTGAGSVSVLRSNNSRDTVWGESVELIRQDVWLGHGLGSAAANIESGSSLLSAALVGGMVTLAATILCIIALILKRASKLGLNDWRTVTILGGLANAMLEGWLLSAGSVFCVIFWLIASSISKGTTVMEPAAHGS